MEDTFGSLPLSTASLSHRLERVNKALLKLDSANASYLAPDISKDDLYGIFIEAREWLLTQLNGLEETDINENMSPDSLKYTYQGEPKRY